MPAVAFASPSIRPEWLAQTTAPLRKTRRAHETVLPTPQQPLPHRDSAGGFSSLRPRYGSEAAYRRRPSFLGMSYLRDSLDGAWIAIDADAKLCMSHFTGGLLDSDIDNKNLLASFGKRPFSRVPDRPRRLPLNAQGRISLPVNLAERLLRHSAMYRQCFVTAHCMCSIPAGLHG